MNAQCVGSAFTCPATWRVAAEYWKHHLSKSPWRSHWAQPLGNVDNGLGPGIEHPVLGTLRLRPYSHQSESHVVRPGVVSLGSNV